MEAIKPSITRTEEDGIQYIIFSGFFEKEFGRTTDPKEMLADYNIRIYDMQTVVDITKVDPLPAAILKAFMYIGKRIQTKPKLICKRKFKDMLKQIGISYLYKVEIVKN